MGGIKMTIGKSGEALVNIDKLIDKYVAKPLREKMHEELFALLPEKVETLSDEEIRETLCGVCRTIPGGYCESSFNCKVVDAEVKALSGRVAKPEAQKENEYCQCSLNIKPGMIVEIEGKVSELICAKCHKKIVFSKPMNDIFSPTEHEKPVEKIKELVPWGEMVPPEPMNAALERTMNKINELVKAVNELREGR